MSPNSQSNNNIAFTSSSLAQPPSLSLSSVGVAGVVVAAASDKEVGIVHVQNETYEDDEDDTNSESYSWDSDDCDGVVEVVDGDDDNYDDNDDGGGQQQHHRHHWGHKPNRTTSKMYSGSVHSLISAFSLNDLGSTGTVSSLEHDSILDGDDYDFHDDDEAHVDKNDIIEKEIWYSQDEVVIGEGSPVGDAINDGCCSWEKGEDNNIDDYNTDLQRTTSRMHESMITGGIKTKSSPQHKLDHPADGIEVDIGQEILAEQGNINRNHFFYDLHTTIDDENVPTNLLSAKQFLSTCADDVSNIKKRLERIEPFSTNVISETTIMDHRPQRLNTIAPPSSNQNNRMSPYLVRRRVSSRDLSMASSEYTEVLVTSSDDSFDVGEGGGGEEEFASNEDGRVILPTWEVQYNASPRANNHRMVVSRGHCYGNYEEMIEEHIDEVEEEEEDDFHDEIIDDAIDVGFYEEVVEYEEELVR
jgi:hypothetical protein